MTATGDKTKRAQVHPEWVRERAELNEVQKSCGFSEQDIEEYNNNATHALLFREVAPICSHPYRAEYLLFLKYMKGRSDYCVRDFFCYANIASSDVDWMYDGHEHLFEGTQLEADKGGAK